MRWIVAGMLAAGFLAGVASVWHRGYVSDESNVLADARQVWRSDFWKVSIRKQYDRFVHPPLLFYIVSPWSFLGDSGMLRAARVSMLVLWALTGWLVRHWATQLYGRRAGLVAAFLYAFCPIVLGHAGLVVNNFLVCAASFLSCYLFYRLLRGGGIGRTLLWGLSLGLAMLSKFTAGVLYPAFAVCALVALLKGGSISGLARNRWLSTGLSLLLGFAASVLVFDAAYRFEGCFRTMGDYRPQSRTLGALMPVLRVLPLPIPRPVVVGTDWQTAQIGEWGSPDYFDYYLMGKHSERGWQSFFVYSFLIKTPIPLLIVLFVALLWIPRIGEVEDMARWVLLVPAALLVVGLSFCYHAFITMAYMLAVYPLLIVYASRVADSVRGPGRFLVPLLGAWYLWCFGTAHPDYVAYANESVGGSREAWRYYIDFQEWSQDRAKVKRYVESLGRPITVLYNKHLGEAGEGWRFAAGGLDSQRDRERLAVYFETTRPQVLDFAFVTACDIPYFESGLLGIGVLELVGLAEPQALAYRWLREGFEPRDRIGASFLVFEVPEAALRKLADRGWRERLAFAHYLWRKRSPEAASFFAALPAGHFEVHYYRSLFYTLNEDTPRATADAVAASALAYGDQRFRLADVFRRLHLSDLERRELLRGLSEEPLNFAIQARVFRGEPTILDALRAARNHDYEYAAQLLTGLGGEAPHPWLLAIDLAYFELQLGNREEARLALDRALRLKPDAQGARAMLRRLEHR